MKYTRKILKIVGISLSVLLILLIVLPLIFKNQIIAGIKSGINQNINAVVDFKDADVSLIRRFPKLSVRLEDVSVVGTGSFAKDSLLSTKTLDASLNVMSLFEDEMQIYAVELGSPRIHALVNKDGLANWDITKADTTSVSDTSTAPSTFKMNLEHYAIEDGYVFYKDEQAGMSAEINGLNHKGSGSFTDEIFTLSTSTSSDGASFTYEGIPYLSKTKTIIESDILVDTKTGKYSFNNSELQLNNLKVNANGFFQLVNDSTYNMDITFKSPSTDFKDVISLIPLVYQADFDKVKTSGKASFEGFVKGTYSETQMPAYDFLLDVSEGSLQYPDLPKPLKNISFSMKATNPDGQADNAVIDISKGHLEMDQDALDFHLLFKNPETVQYIDGAAKGKIDLSQISKFVKLDAATKLSGMVWADLFAKGNMRALQNQQGDFSAGGFLNFKDLFYASKDFPQPIQHGNMNINIANTGGIADQTTINISEGHVEIGNDPLDFTFQLKKPMTSADFSGTAKGRFNLNGISQFTKLEEGTSISGILNGDVEFAGSKTLIDKEAYEQFIINGIAGLKELRYVSTDYPKGIMVSSAAMNFTNKQLAIEHFNGNYLQSNFTANGNVSNYIGYALSNTPLRGNINVTVDKMDLADWMGVSTDTSSSSTTSSAPFPVPADLDIKINAKAGSVKYDGVEYKDIDGSLKLSNETVQLENVSANALDGNIVFNGSYSTLVNKTHPAINLNYTVKDIDIQKAFFAFNSMEKLMPVGKFLSGKLSSQLNLKGSLDGQLMPQLNSLTGNGNMLLLEGVLKKFAPLEKIAAHLQVDHLKEVSLKDVKSYIEFSNGQVLVKPFTVMVKDIEMQIGGMHGFDQSIDYIVQMKIPRSYLGNKGNALVYQLAAKANEKGVPVKIGDIVNLSIKLAGKMSNPTIATELKEVAGDAAKELKQQAVDFAKQKVDSAKGNIKDSLTQVKKNVTEDIKKEISNQVFGSKDSSGKTNLDSTKKKATETLKNTFKGILNKKKKTDS